MGWDTFWATFSQTHLVTLPLPLLTLWAFSIAAHFFP
jgi:hypothetical protein